MNNVNEQYIPTIVVNADGTETIEKIPCGTLKETKFGNNVNSVRTTPKKFVPKFGK